MYKHLWLARAALFVAASWGQGTLWVASAQTPAVPPEPAQLATADPATAPAAAIMTIPAGTPLNVRLDQPLDTKHERAGERFTATLANPVVVGNQVILPAGTRFSGRLTQVRQSGRLRGRAQLSVQLDSVEWRGRSYAIETSSITQESGGHRGRNWGLIGGGTGFGAMVGGIAGGGAGAGAAAGTAGAAATGRRQAELPAETLLVFSLNRPVQLGSH